MLHTEYRPKSLDDVFGNDAAVKLAESVISDPDQTHAVLLHGPTGTGKTTLARIMADGLSVAEQDVEEFDSADFRGIDTIRGIRSSMTLAPFAGERRAFILDECHQLTRDAQNGLLKALEEPPKHVYFFLCTTEPQKLLPTLRGRCFKIETELLHASDMQNLLVHVLVEEDRKISDKAKTTIINSALGCPREALVILEQVLSSNSAKEQERIAAKVAVNQSEMIELCRAIMQRKPWKTIAPIIKNLDANPESTRLMILSYFSTVLLSGKDAARVWLIMDAFQTPYYDTGKAGLVYSCYAALEAAKDA